MATLYRYKCKESGYTINSSQDGDYTLMSGPGHIYKCSECNHVFTKVWARWDLDAIVKDYSFKKDDHLADFLKRIVPEELYEVFKKDILWFQQEIRKGNESRYYGKTITHDAVTWTDEIFLAKLLKFLQGKDYVKSIKLELLMPAIKEHILLKKHAAYLNSTHHVKCHQCGAEAHPWAPSCGCPQCGKILLEEQELMILVD